MYVPDSFAVTDPEKLAELMRRHSFATLISLLDGSPTATHLPIRYDAEGQHGRLAGHIARANPQWRHFDETREVLVIFQGPHSYISPNWYTIQPAVPTWNYAVVHAYGAPRIMEDHDRIVALLDTLVTTYESEFPTPWAGNLPPDYRDQMLRAIVAFEIEITRLEGKFKLSQNRDRADIEGVLHALAAFPTDERQALAQLMRGILD